MAYNFRYLIYNIRPKCRLIQFDSEEKQKYFQSKYLASKCFVL